MRQATIKADQKVWIHPHDGLVQTFESRKMNGDFTMEIALVLRVARIAGHLLGILTGYFVSTITIVCVYRVRKPT